MLPNGSTKQAVQTKGAPTPLAECRDTRLAFAACTTQTGQGTRRPGTGRPPLPASARRLKSPGCRIRSLPGHRCCGSLAWLPCLHPLLPRRSGRRGAGRAGGRRLCATLRGLPRPRPAQYQWRLVVRSAQAQARRARPLRGLGNVGQGQHAVMVRHPQGRRDRGDLVLYSRHGR